MKRIVPYETGMGITIDILKTLEEEPRQSPGMMKNKLEEAGIKYSISSIKSALHYMGPDNLQLVKRVARGFYEISDAGKYVLHQTLNGQSRRTEL